MSITYKKKVFIDGAEGTTGLRIYDRFENREDITLLHIDEALRKDPNERKKLINSSDITFLCLPDAAAIESASLVENPDVTVIDTSTAHRTDPAWAYGFPELSAQHAENIAKSHRIAVPGCHASGFIALTYPLVAGGILGPDAPLSCFSLTGYSGGGKKMIASYEASDKPADLFAPRPYGLSQQHKHLKEMKAVCGLSAPPVFVPIVDDYYSGMLVTLPLHASMLKGAQSAEQLAAYYDSYYGHTGLVSVLSYNNEITASGFISANTMTGKDTMQIIVTGNDERITAYALFDNLGKGASGAAIQCMNISLGIDQTTGLQL